MTGRILRDLTQVEPLNIGARIAGNSLEREISENRARALRELLPVQRIQDQVLHLDGADLHRPLPVEFVKPEEPDLWVERKRRSFRKPVGQRLKLTGKQNEALRVRALALGER